MLFMIFTYSIHATFLSSSFICFTKIMAKIVFMALWWLVRNSTINIMLQNKDVKLFKRAIKLNIEFVYLFRLIDLYCYQCFPFLSWNWTILCHSASLASVIAKFLPFPAITGTWVGETYWPFLLLLLIIVSCLISPQQSSWLLLYLCLLINHYHTSPRCNLLRRAEKIAASLEQPGAFASWLTI